MSSVTARDLFVAALRNAHAMERRGVEFMERQLAATRAYPELRGRLREHIEETRRQLHRLEECLRACGSNAAIRKDRKMPFKMPFDSSASADAMGGDGILKNTFANSAFEHYEIAAYQALVILAEQAGIGFAENLKTSLAEEVRMAKWIEEHIEDIAMTHLAREQTAAAEPAVAEDAIVVPASVSDTARMQP